jgi:transposase
VAQVQADHPAAAVETWSQDEGRLGLKPIVRRLSVRCKTHPRSINCQRYDWLYAYGFVHPASGRTWWLILPTVRTDVMSLALREFAAAQGVGADKQIVVVVDGAGWHTSGQLVVPDGVHLVYLPAHTPELQPAERLWPLLHEVMANQPFADLDALEKVVAERCDTITTLTDVVQALTQYHWWPTC